MSLGTFVRTWLPLVILLALIVKIWPTGKLDFGNTTPWAGLILEIDTSTISDLNPGVIVAGLPVCSRPRGRKGPLYLRRCRVDRHFRNLTHTSGRKSGRSKTPKSDSSAGNCRAAPISPTDLLCEKSPQRNTSGRNGGIAPAGRAAPVEACIEGHGFPCRRPRARTSQNRALRQV